MKNENTHTHNKLCVCFGHEKMQHLSSKAKSLAPNYQSPDIDTDKMKIRDLHSRNTMYLILYTASLMYHIKVQITQIGAELI